ncbi:MAG: RNA polymerase sigma factor [Clostridiaceae bacterium]|jgi:RNA polymerase sigma-70 factor (ECF subfamily)|nr:RNA polymerase sigma factor [Clostridiaceae bacterium]
MDDKQIVDLYWVRSEKAITETANKYGKYCYYIAYNILYNNNDSEECVNDTYLKAWNVIPPQRPNKLSTFLGKITRNLALDRYRYNSREKRRGSQVPLIIDELAECISATGNIEHIIDEMVLVDCLNRFLAMLPAETRKIFMRRYWYFSPIKDIAKDFSISKSNVKMTLLRARNKLKQLLEKEGIEI